MKTKEILKGNRLIAEFLNAPIWARDGGLAEYELYLVSELDYVFCDIEASDPTSRHFYSAEEMHFSESWDWLMPVVEKIEKEGFNVHITSGWKRHSGVTKITHVCDITISGFFSKNHEHWSKFGDTKIKAVYLAIIEFVKWYNENKPEFMEDYLNPEDIEDINDSLSK